MRLILHRTSWCYRDSTRARVVRVIHAIPPNIFDSRWIHQTSCTQETTTPQSPINFRGMECTRVCVCRYQASFTLTMVIKYANLLTPLPWTESSERGQECGFTRETVCAYKYQHAKNRMRRARENASQPNKERSSWLCNTTRHDRPPNRSARRCILSPHSACCLQGRID